MIRRGAARIAFAILFAVGAATFPCIAETIDLPRPVPAFNQGYTDGPDAWGRCALGTDGCPDDIYGTGCLITAFASVLAYYDVELSVSAAFSCTGTSRAGMNPGIFNDWLRETGGYGHCAQDPAGNCCLIWERLPAAIETTTHVNRSEVGLNPVSAVVLDHALRQGYPVIAGVHYGASCGGGTSPSEDCHWVVITGKRDDTYTIIDPFNRDSTSPYGIRTTLGAGVHGRYIIDRFVVVEPAAGAAIGLQLAAVPDRASFQVGDRIRLTLSAPASAGEVLPYVRATRPDGRMVYAVRDASAASGIRWSETRESLFSEPVLLSTGQAWYDHRILRDDAGEWRWEAWIERADGSGIAVDRASLDYRVESNAGSIGVAVVGVLFIVAIAVIAVVSSFGPAQE